MAIKPSDVTFTTDTGTPLKNGSLHQLFPASRVGSATDYDFVVVTNTHATLTLSAVKAWMSAGRGAAVAIALANGPIAASAAFSAVSVSGLAYSSPTTRATGLAVANIGPGQKIRLAVRRTFTSAVVASPQTARLYVGGTSPI